MNGYLQGGVRLRHRSPYPFTRDDERWIHGGIEGGGGVGPVFEQAQVMIVSQQSSHAATGQRAPQLDGEQQRHGSAGPGKVHASLREEGGEIDLCGEAGAGPRVGGAPLPRGIAIDAKLRLEPLTAIGRDAVQPHPWRISHDDVESAAGRYVGKVRRKAKGKGAAPLQRTPRSAE